ncbi:hypothetical protein ABS735_03065 [Streptomyces sp. MMCC 100]|uniref:hypothetical protein n=1 Tax=Streptomyces sp. MMCC 100 TaxID=3163555 RepID=UPI0035964CE9
MDITDPKDLVRRRYDANSLRYDEAYGAERKYQSVERPPLLLKIAGWLRPGGCFWARRS